MSASARSYDSAETRTQLFVFLFSPFAASSGRSHVGTDRLAYQEQGDKPSLTHSANYPVRAIRTKPRLGCRSSCQAAAPTLSGPPALGWRWTMDDGSGEPRIYFLSDFHRSPRLEKCILSATVASSTGQPDPSGLPLLAASVLVPYASLVENHRRSMAQWLVRIPSSSDDFPPLRRRQIPALARSPMIDSAQDSAPRY